MDSKNKHSKRRIAPSKAKGRSKIHYLIVTTGEKTEINYFKGFCNKLNEAKRGYIHINRKKCDITEIIQKAESESRKCQNIYKTWLVFDIDEYTDIVNKVVKEANNKGYNIAFSNPCIEIWFLAYFGKSPNVNTASQCQTELKKYFKKYRKTDEKIYEALITEGDEIKAIEVAKKRYEYYENYENIDILKMYGATSVYQLVEEIKYTPTNLP